MDGNNTPKKNSMIYGLLTLGFIFKSIGAAWDVSYHAKFFREFYQLPHLVNGFGDVILVFLLIYLWRREPETGRMPLKIIAAGMITFLVGIVLWLTYYITFENKAWAGPK